jgi:hypothetical protein
VLVSARPRSNIRAVWHLDEFVVPNVRAVPRVHLFPADFTVRQTVILGHGFFVPNFINCPAVRAFKRFRHLKKYTPVRCWLLDERSSYAGRPPAPAKLSANCDFHQGYSTPCPAESRLLYRRTNRPPGLCYPAKDQQALAAECRRLKSMLVPNKRPLLQISSCAHARCENWPTLKP